MLEIAQIRKLSLWIFFLPLVAINLCLIISINFEFLNGTIFEVDMIGRSAFSIPYIDGSLSISRASRTFPAYLVFKPAMILTSVLLYFYWKKNNKIIGEFNQNFNKNYKWKMVTTWPPNFPVLGEGCNILSKWINKMSGGRLEIKVYGGGELIPSLECFDAVSSGAI